MNQPNNPVNEAVSVDPNRPVPRAVEELHYLIRAQYKLVYVASAEEQRVERWIRDLAHLDNEVLRQRWDITNWKSRQFITWSCSQGFKSDSIDVPGDIREPIRALDWIANGLNRDAVVVLRDFHPFLKDPMVARRVRDLVTLFDNAQTKRTVIFLSPLLKLPMELEKDVQVIDFDLPDLETLKNIVREKAYAGARSRRFGANFQKVLESQDLQREVAEAALGLTEAEARQGFDKTSVRDKMFSIPTILQEKKHIIRKSGILEFYETKLGMGSVGGLPELKAWLQKRQYSFTQQARDFGLPAPKGILLLGVPGCGKSLSAKAISQAWQMPLLRLDVGKVFGSLVGSSEENMRRAIQTAEAVAPAIMWLDELEKGFSGTKSSGSSDGGTTARVFATFLTWLQEKESPVFVIATANDVSQLPPELLRKGRFDEIFFVDLPNRDERGKILEIHLAKRGRDPASFDMRRLVDRSAGYSGSELEEVIVTALYNAYDEGLGETDISTDSMLTAMDEVIPLSQTMRERLSGMREWAKSRARRASPPDADEQDEEEDSPRLEL
ncbi:MAG TPA: ATPase [Myxococcales bacterium]|nr:ATPase [Myxococcales bacterium]HAN32082.1 ATPase [Myxococcales bacterium]